MFVKSHSVFTILLLVLSMVSQFSWGHGAKFYKKKDGPPAPTYSPEDSIPELGIFVTPSGEQFNEISLEKWLLHQDNHDYTPIISGVIPSIFEPPVLDSVDDYALRAKDLVVINPAPEEYIWIMEGKRHGFQNLTIALTDTQPGNGAPLHTHEDEEAHVLLRGKMRYFLGDEEFVVKAPYVVHIPPMVPHAFMNVSKKSVNLIGIFPANEWEYDVLDAQVFDEGEDDVYADDKNHKNWHGEKRRLKRMKKYREKESSYNPVKHSHFNNQVIK
ncbi:MAG: cupin domain-containing protein [Cellvibrionaceae bacterium]